MDPSWDILTYWSSAQRSCFLHVPAPVWRYSPSDLGNRLVDPAVLEAAWRIIPLSNWWKQPWLVPSGKHTKKLLKMAIEIVDLPMKNMVVFQFVMGQFTRPGKSMGYADPRWWSKGLTASHGHHPAARLSLTHPRAQQGCRHSAARESDSGAATAPGCSGLVQLGPLSLVHWKCGLL